MDTISSAAGLLPQSILTAVAEVIERHTGLSPGFVASADANALPADPSLVALAVAYANLVLDEPEAVTQQHLKMLRKCFSIEQIHELSRFIKEKTGA